MVVEMTPWAKSLLGKHESMSLNQQYPHEGWFCPTCLEPQSWYGRNGQILEAQWSVSLASGSGRSLISRELRHVTSSSGLDRGMCNVHSHLNTLTQNQIVMRLHYLIIHFHIQVNVSYRTSFLIKLCKGTYLI